MGRRFLDFDKICYLARLPAIKTVYTRLTSDLYSCGCPGAGRTRAISRIMESPAYVFPRFRLLNVLLNVLVHILFLSTSI